MEMAHSFRVQFLSGTGSGAAEIFGNVGDTERIAKRDQLVGIPSFFLIIFVLITRQCKYVFE